MRVFIILAIILLSSCAQFKKDSSEDRERQEEFVVDFDIDQIKERGKLIAIVDNSSTGYFIYKGQPMGYEHDLLQRFCKEIDVELEIKVTKSIDESIQMLNNGDGDLIAYFLTITRERKKRVDFTNNLVTTRQVLVQKKPEGWEKMWSGRIDDLLIRNQVDLIGKEVNVRQSSSFVQRLHNLSDEIGGDIIIVEAASDMETEDLIKDVQAGIIDYTVADEQIAMINAAYYPELDVLTPLSFPQQIGWAVRKNAPELKQVLNQWVDEIKLNSFHQVVYNKYFKVSRTILERAQSDLSSIRGKSISNYDKIVKKYAATIGWDWKLVSSLMYQESRFRSSVTSWAGAQGLMQVMPRTGAQFGASNLFDPEQNIKAGCGFIKYLDKQWAKVIADSTERKNFILASYNAGLGHVQDAVALAESLNYDPKVWKDNVESAMKLKSKPEFFRSEVVKYGYCRGESVVNYVDQILTRYDQYAHHFPETIASE